MTKRKSGKDYFVRANTAGMVFVVFGMGFYTIACFKPEIIPYGSLGPFGTFVKNLVDNHPQALYKGYIFAWALHVGEALLAIPVCSAKGITDTSACVKWFFQNFLFGVFSFYNLLVYNTHKMK